MDSVFKALSDKNRRDILSLLKKKDMTVGEIKKHFKITGASLSHHLDILKRANLVTAERDGQFIKYSLNVSVFEEIMKLFYKFFK
ncbi:winged helix-turn-helix transcriptional regulator [Candidatus Peregrinibacteria bacterium]|nr:winged helix-turn-helix transcriptional regulator [Candidatus Peregrinibacteria bacterium]